MARQWGATFLCSETQFCLCLEVSGSQDPATQIKLLRDLCLIRLATSLYAMGNVFSRTRRLLRVGTMSPADICLSKNLMRMESQKTSCPSPDTYRIRRTIPTSQGRPRRQCLVSGSRIHSANIYQACQQIC